MLKGHSIRKVERHWLKQRSTLAAVAMGFHGVYICLVYVCLHAGSCGSQKLVLCLPQLLPIFIFKTRSLPGLEFTRQARLAGQ